MSMMPIFTMITETDKSLPSQRITVILAIATLVCRVSSFLRRSVSSGKVSGTFFLYDPDGNLPEFNEIRTGRQGEHSYDWDDEE